MQSFLNENMVVLNKYRWSTTQNQDLPERRKDVSFIQQIKWGAKELGL